MIEQHGPMPSSDAIWAFTRARQRASAGPRRKPITEEVRRVVLRRDANRCVWCGTHRDLCVDHIIPFSKGGADAVENYQTLCRSCNSRKGNRL